MRIKEFFVVWRVELVARDHREAAELAQRLMRDPVTWRFTVEEKGDGIHRVIKVHEDRSVSEEG